MNRSIWIGWDPREEDAFRVCVRSLIDHASRPIDIFGIRLDVLQARGMYQRPTGRTYNGILLDAISGAPMSTEFAISRFFIPHLCTEGLALFMDCDMLVRTDIHKLFDAADPVRAIEVVQHDYQPTEAFKMDGQVQQSYARKNWSSVMLWNLDHPAHRRLTLFALNQWAGRALHGFEWLEDSEIGALDPAWNHLVGVNPPNPEARIAHFTLGIPRMPGYEDCEHADEWRATLERC